MFKQRILLRLSVKLHDENAEPIKFRFKEIALPIFSQSCFLFGFMSVTSQQQVYRLDIMMMQNIILLQHNFAEAKADKNSSERDQNSSCLVKQQRQIKIVLKGTKIVGSWSVTQMNISKRSIPREVQPQHENVELFGFCF